MKATRVWTCPCEETVIFRPVGEPSSLIVRGRGFHAGNEESARYIYCSGCGNRYRDTPAIMVANGLRTVWECDHTKIMETEEGDLVVRGEGFRYGSPVTHIRCRECGEQYRVAAKIKWWGHVSQKKAKRRQSRANRKARRRRD